MKPTPTDLYQFFQYLAAGVFASGMFFSLKRGLGVVPSALLSTLPLALSPTIARIVSDGTGTEGGQSYYGALAAQVLLIALLVRWVWKFRPALERKIWDSFALSASLAYSILRLGCHFRGCCWGTICPHSWAIFYRSSDVVTPLLLVPLHPVQLYSAAHGLVIFGLLLFLLRSARGRSDSRPPLSALGLFLTLLGIGRLLTDAFRADEAYYGLSWFGFAPNTILSSIAALVGILVCRSFYFFRPC